LEDNRKKLAKLSREEYRSVVAERLKAIAELHNLDTKTYAEKCGISTRRMKNLMNGTANLRIPEMLDISDAFNVGIEFIMGCYPYPLPMPKDETEAAVYELVGKMDMDELKEFKDRLGEKLKETES
jgi:transcriptional regulator with XRE-family HTH domain